MANREQKAPPGRRNHPRRALRAFVFTRENAHDWAGRNPIPLRRPWGALNTNLCIGGFLHPSSFILSPDKPLEKAWKLKNLGKAGPKPELAKNRISPHPGGWCVVGRPSEACLGAAPFLLSYRLQAPAAPPIFRPVGPEIRQPRPSAWESRWRIANKKPHRGDVIILARRAFVFTRENAHDWAGCAKLGSGIQISHEAAVPIFLLDAWAVC